MKTILVLTDFSKGAQQAAEFALEIAAKAGAEILLYHAFYAPHVVSLESGIYPYNEDYSDIEQEGIAEMEKLTQNLDQEFIKTHTAPPPAIRLMNEPGDLAENIKKITRENNIWMIVMGDKKKEGAVSRFVFGSHGNAVIDHAACPVLIVPVKAKLREMEKIIFASELDHSEHAAVLFLEKLAEMWHSQVTVLHVCEKSLSVEEKVSHYADYKKILSGIKYPDIRYVDVRGDDITNTISTYAGREKIDLIAIAHKKRSFIGALLHSSISKKMMNYHSVPLLVLHKP